MRCRARGAQGALQSEIKWGGDLVFFSEPWATSRSILPKPSPVIGWFALPMSKLGIIDHRTERNNRNKPGRLSAMYRVYSISYFSGCALERSGRVSHLTLVSLRAGLLPLPPKCERGLI